MGRKDCEKIFINTEILRFAQNDEVVVGYSSIRSERHLSRLPEGAYFAPEGTPSHDSKLLFLSFP